MADHDQNSKDGNENEEGIKRRARRPPFIFDFAVKPSFKEIERWSLESEAPVKKFARKPRPMPIETKTVVVAVASKTPPPAVPEIKLPEVPEPSPSLYSNGPKEEFYRKVTQVLEVEDEGDNDYNPPPPPSAAGNSGITFTSTNIITTATDAPMPKPSPSSKPDDLAISVPTACDELDTSVKNRGVMKQTQGRQEQEEEVIQRQQQPAIHYTSTSIPALSRMHYLDMQKVNVQLDTVTIEDLKLTKSLAKPLYSASTSDEDSSEILKNNIYFMGRIMKGGKFVLARLVASGLLTSQDQNEIAIMPSAFQRNILMLTKLIEKPEDKFVDFAEVLSMTGNGCLVSLMGERPAPLSVHEDEVPAINNNCPSPSPVPGEEDAVDSVKVLGEWQCVKCTLINHVSETCDACGEFCPPNQRFVVCTRCTFENHPLNGRCDMCNYTL